MLILNFLLGLFCHELIVRVTKEGMHEAKSSKELCLLDHLETRWAEPTNSTST